MVYYCRIHLHNNRGIEHIPKCFPTPLYLHHRLKQEHEKDKVATSPHFSGVLKEHLETNEETNSLLN